MWLARVNNVTWIITQSTLGLLALLRPTVHKSLPTCKTKPKYDHSEIECPIPDDDMIHLHSHFANCCFVKPYFQLTRTISCMLMLIPCYTYKSCHASLASYPGSFPLKVHEKKSLSTRLVLACNVITNPLSCIRSRKELNCLKAVSIASRVSSSFNPNKERTTHTNPVSL